jgi:hypothetical protein
MECSAWADVCDAISSFSDAQDLLKETERSDK